MHLLEVAPSIGKLSGFPQGNGRLSSFGHLPVQGHKALCSIELDHPTGWDRPLKKMGFVKRL